MTAVLENHRALPSELTDAFKKLESFVAIPSISNIHDPDYNPDNIQKAANFAAQLAHDIGFQVRQVKLDGGASFVIANKIVDVSKKTLLLYGHYDVQPVERDKWKTDPFVLTERDGRLYGRGASDDKGGVVAIITALGSYIKAYGVLPVNVKLLFEGEEEFVSGGMRELIQREKVALAADALVVMDGVNTGLDVGTLTVSTRGLVTLKLKVSVMDKPVHSGGGCLIPDPAMILAQLITSLRDPRGIPGFMDGCKEPDLAEKKQLKMHSKSEKVYAEEFGVFNGVSLRGDQNKSINERMLTEPSITIINGNWGKPNGGNSIQEAASCEISARITHGQDPKVITGVLINHLAAQPILPGVKVEIIPEEDFCTAWKADLSKPYFQVYLEALSENFNATDIRITGGALPLLSDFQEVMSDVELIVAGVEDLKCAAHSHNESQDIGLFERAVNSLIAFIQKMGKV